MDLQFGDPAPCSGQLSVVGGGHTGQPSREPATETNGGLADGRLGIEPVLPVFLGSGT
jgi:hypothetical protein